MDGLPRIDTDQPLPLTTEERARLVDALTTLVRAIRDDTFGTIPAGMPETLHVTNVSGVRPITVSVRVARRH